MNRKFAPSQILFHWTIFILVVLTYAAMELKGFAAKGSDIRELMKTIHYTLGVSVMILMLIRIILKVTHKDPAITPPPHVGNLFFQKLFMVFCTFYLSVCHCSAFYLCIMDMSNGHFSRMPCR